MTSKNNTARGKKMRLPCPHCGSPLYIQTPKQQTPAVRDFYTTCNNEACLARPVMTISHKSDLQPPISKLSGEAGLVATLLKSMSSTDRKKIMQLLAAQLEDDKLKTG